MNHNKNIMGPNGALPTSKDQGSLRVLGHTCEISEIAKHLKIV